MGPPHWGSGGLFSKMGLNCWGRVFDSFLISQSSEISYKASSESASFLALAVHSISFFYCQNVYKIVMYISG